LRGAGLEVDHAATGGGASFQRHVVGDESDEVAGEGSGKSRPAPAFAGLIHGDQLGVAAAQAPMIPEAAAYFGHITEVVSMEHATILVA